MLALDDPRWESLTHAYGAASDIPLLLRNLAAAPGPTVRADDEPWFGLWSALCHQGDAFDASYAAVPHVVQIGCIAPEPLDFSFYQLPAAIEVARRTGRGPDIPTDLADAYHDAIARLMDLIALHQQEAWDEDTLLSVASAQAVAKGHIAVAEALLNLDPVWIERINRGDFE